MLKEKSRSLLSKTLAYTLAFVLVLGLMPVNLFANENGDQNIQVEENLTENREAADAETEATEEESPEATTVEDEAVAEIIEGEEAAEVDNSALFEDAPATDEMDLSNAILVEAQTPAKPFESTQEIIEIIENEGNNAKEIIRNRFDNMTIEGLIESAFNLNVLGSICVDISAPWTKGEEASEVMKLEYEYKTNTLIVKFKEKKEQANYTEVKLGLTKQNMMAVLLRTFGRTQKSELSVKHFIKALMLQALKDYNVDEKDLNVSKIRAFFNSLGYEANEMGGFKIKLLNLNDKEAFKKELRDQFKKELDQKLADFLNNQELPQVNPTVKVEVMPKDPENFNGISFTAQEGYDPNTNLNLIDFTNKTDNLVELEIGIYKKFKGKEEEAILKASAENKKNVFKFAFGKNANLDSDDVIKGTITKRALITKIATQLLGDNNKDTSFMGLVKIGIDAISKIQGFEKLNKDTVVTTIKNTLTELGYGNSTKDLFDLLISNETEFEDGGEKATVKVYLHPKKFKVRFDSNGGSPTPEAQIIEYKGRVTQPKEKPKKDGHKFLGWYKADSQYPFIFGIGGGDIYDVTKEFTLTAKWEQEEEANKPSTPPTGGSTGGDTTGSDSYNPAPAPAPNNNTNNNTNNNNTNNNNTVIDENETPLGALEEINKLYMTGYEDGTIQPETKVTREVAATMLYRLLDEKTLAEIKGEDVKFSDMKETDWSYKYVQALVKAGIFKGHTDGTFKPSMAISRSELAAVLVRYFKIEEAMEHKFEDVKGHWAEKMIAGLAAKGYVAGYTDGSFMPDKELTRAEMAAMVNKILGRNLKKEELRAELNKFTDLKAEEWYYADLIMASNTYKSMRGEDGIQKFVEVMK